MSAHSFEKHDALIESELSEPDAAALDALIAAGWDWRATPERIQPRAKRAAELLGLLGTAVAGEHSEAIASATLARIDAWERRTSEEVSISPDDEEAIDALMDEEMRPERVPHALRDRAERVALLGRLVTRVPVEGERSRELVDRTMMRVQAMPRARAMREGVIASIGARAGGFRMTDLIGVAAVLLIGASVIWPAASAMGSHRSKQMCAGNMGAIAGAMGAYAADYRGSLPQAASFSGQTWWDVGSTPERSNSANLFTLARAGYERLRTFACAGNASACRRSACGEARDWNSLEEVSYSYQLVFGAREATTWNRSGSAVILADRSPVILRAARGQAWNELMNSPNHDGRGQWVLRNDGSGLWLDSPVFIQSEGGHGAREDNIWLPGVLEVGLRKIREEYRNGTLKGEVQIQGNELPASNQDAFLVP